MFAVFCGEFGDAYVKDSGLEGGQVCVYGVLWNGNSVLVIHLTLTAFKHARRRTFVYTSPHLLIVAKTISF